VDEVWQGFVLFGLSYSYQLLRGRVLSIPANALQRPIEDWWGISHEVAHSISWAKDFYRQELPSDIKENLQEIQAPISSFTSFDPQEIYAHWFDYTYIFQGNAEYYFPTIWKSWLRWERTREFKVDYLLRSLIIYMTKQLDSLYSAHNQSFEQTVDLLTSKYKEMKDKITQRVPEFREFASDIDEIQIRDMTLVIQQVEPFLNFLENQYFDHNMYNRLNPKYDKLDNHIALLQDGVVITEDIVNPIKLLHKLMDVLNVYHDPVPLKTTAATVLSLWHKHFVSSVK